MPTKIPWTDESWNPAGNLELVTYSENMKHAFRKGFKNQDGEQNPNAKLSNEEVRRIRELYATGNYLQQELARVFDVSFQTISGIVRGEDRQVQSGPVDNKDHRDCFCERDAKTGRFVGKKHAGRLLDGQVWDQFPVSMPG